MKPSGERIDRTTLTRLLPMYLLLDPSGQILSAGVTMRKLIKSHTHFDDCLALKRVKHDRDPIGQIAEKVVAGDRVFLHLRHTTLPPLRGHGDVLQDGSILLNMGFGIGIIKAISEFSLTDADFSASDLTIELLYLHEANSSLLKALSNHNLDLEQARKTAEHQAFTDPLTKLVNRRGLELSLDLALHQTVRGHQRSTLSEDCEFSLIHIDLDYFKQVNDQFGHAAGDHVLITVAQILREETRSRDSVARVGGDEFVILVRGSDGIDDLGHRIIKRLEAPIPFENNLCHISASMGVASSAQYPIPTLFDMGRDADAALYQAKHAGRGRIMHHTPKRGI